MGRKPDFQSEVQDAGQAETGRSGRRQSQEARLEVLPAEDRSLPYRAIPELDKSRPTPQCWWCASGTLTRDHLFKGCVEWMDQQRTLWAEARKETGRWKSRWKVRDLLAHERCSRAVLDFLSTKDVGRWVPAPAEEDAQSKASEWELRGRRGREEERRAEDGAGRRG